MGMFDDGPVTTWAKQFMAGAAGALAAIQSSKMRREAEDRQRERMNAKFASRKPTPATADADFRAPNNVIEPR